MRRAVTTFGTRSARKNTMKVFHNERHALHHGRNEMFRGELVPCFEVPARADFVLQELQARGLAQFGVVPDVNSRCSRACMRRVICTSCPRPGTSGSHWIPPT